MKVDVDLIGVAEAEAKIGRLAFMMSLRVKGVINEAALNIQREAKRNCPVDTGRLRSSIRPTFYPSGLAAVIGTDVVYAPHVEYGTRATKAQPFLFPAFEAVVPEYLEELKDALKALERVR